MDGESIKFLVDNISKLSELNTLTNLLAFTEAAIASKVKVNETSERNITLEEFLTLLKGWLDLSIGDLERELEIKHGNN